MPDCPYGSSYDPPVSPLAASTSGPVPVTPLAAPRDRSARRKLTAGTFAGCGMSVGVGAGVLVVTTSLVRGVSVASGGGGAATHAAASSIAAAAMAGRRAPLIRARRSPVRYPRRVRRQRSPNWVDHV